MERYWQQVYNSLLFLGGNEMGPRTTLEMIFAPCILIFLTCLNAWLFGEMSMLSEQTGAKLSKFEMEINITNTSCKKFRVPKSFRREIREDHIKNV